MAGLTLAVVAGVVLRGSPALRLWAPLAGIVVGCAVAAPFGMYEVQTVIDAPWVGVPVASWPGLDDTFGHEFWALLPAFIAVTIVGAIETVGDGVAIQRVSRRRPQATDFRVVQGCLNADGLGNFLSGIAGTPPNTTYSSSISITEVTGVAARLVGLVIGVTMIVMAFFPKVAVLLIAIPGPVVAAHATVFLGILFVQGMRMVVEDGIDHRKAAIAGVTFRVGVGFQNGWIFAEQLGDGFLGVLLGNGMTAGAITAVLLVLFLNLTGTRHWRLAVPLKSESLAEVDGFLRRFARWAGWNEPSTEGLASAGEETLAVVAGAPRGGHSAAAVGGGACRGRRGGTGVRDVAGRGERGGPPGIPEQAASEAGRAGGVVPAAAALRIVGDAPEVPWGGHSDGACGEQPVGGCRGVRSGFDKLTMHGRGSP